MSRLIWAHLTLLDGDSESAEMHALIALDLAHAPRQPLGLMAAHRLRGEPLVDSRRLDEVAERLDTSRQLAHACEARLN